MRLYTTLFLLGTFFSLRAQVELRPLSTNPTLQREAAWQQADFEREVRQLLHSDWQPAAGADREGCRFDNLDTRYADLGTDTLFILVDTLGAPNGGEGPLEFVDCAVDSDLGEAFFYENSDTVAYVFTPGTPSGTDTVCVQLCDGSDCSTFSYPVVLRRPGTRYELPAVSVDEFSTEITCVDLGLLPAPGECGQLIDNPNNDYTGTGGRLVYLETYDEVSECIIYKSGGIVGQDVIWYEVCDEFKICDTFQISIDVDVQPFGNLPFFDDFSYEGPYPSRTYWLDRNVFVNNTLAENAPSIGMASSDGLNSGGRPYDSPPGGALADRLTSRPIDLSGFDAGDGLTLKYFLSRKGVGNPPNALDSFQVEFRAADGSWEQIDVFEGYSSPPAILQSDPFEFQVVIIDENRFLHEDFQFRFSNYVTAVGGYEDFWHLDYVRLAANEGTNPTFRDVAFVLPPTDVLERYSQMPYNQFLANVEGEVGTSFFVKLFNHFAQAQNLDASGIFVKELNTGEMLPGFLTTIVDAVNLDSQEFFEDTRDNPRRDDLVAFLDDYEGVDVPKFEVSYTFSLAEQTAEYFRNDTVRTVTCFDETFAYDDGTAEFALYLQNAQGSNPELAVRYTANEPDTLRGIQFHFPRVNETTESQLFNIKVWIGELDDDPEYNAIFQKPLFISDVVDSLQGFTTYALTDELGVPTPLFIPEGDFYIGWQQVSSVGLGIGVGFDFNNDANEYTFLRVGLDWEPFVYDIDGALMMRALFGDDEVQPTTGTEELTAEERLEIFPNPTTGPVRLRSKSFHAHTTRIQVYNQIGQLVLEQPFDEEIDLSGAGQGVFYVQLSNPATGERVHRKIVVQE